MRQNTRRNPLADKDLKNLEKSENGPKKAGASFLIHHVFDFAQSWLVEELFRRGKMSPYRFGTGLCKHSDFVQSERIAKKNRVFLQTEIWQTFQCGQSLADDWRTASRLYNRHRPSHLFSALRDHGAGTD